MTSATGFDRLHPVVQHHVVNTLGWPALRALQEDSIAPILRGDDALLLAPTAGGKTEAALDTLDAIELPLLVPGHGEPTDHSRIAHHRALLQAAQD